LFCDVVVVVETTSAVSAVVSAVTVDDSLVVDGLSKSISGSKFFGLFVTAVDWTVSATGELSDLGSSFIGTPLLSLESELAVPDVAADGMLRSLVEAVVVGMTDVVESGRGSGVDAVVVEVQGNLLHSWSLDGFSSIGHARPPTQVTSRNWTPPPQIRVHCTE
jgi:hypothetical protein